MMRGAHEMVGPTSLTPPFSLSLSSLCQGPCTYAGRKGPLVVLDTHTKCLQICKVPQYSHGQKVPNPTNTPLRILQQLHLSTGPCSHHYLTSCFGHKFTPAGSPSMRNSSETQQSPENYIDRKWMGHSFTSYPSYQEAQLQYPPGGGGV